MSNGIEERRMALQDLMTYIFVSRDDEPEAYRRVRLHEAHLRNWLLDRPGWRLLAGRGTYRLERLPSRVVLERGLLGLRTPMDYACLCWVLWFAENRSASTTDWFVISDLAAAVARVANGVFSLGDRTHREALVRALQLLEELNVLTNRDGDARSWVADASRDGEAPEVLYDFTADAPRLLANFSYSGLARLREGSTGECLLPQTGEEAQPPARAWQALLLGPGFWRHDDPEAFAELQDSAVRVHEELEGALGWGLEVGRDYARIWRVSTTRSGAGTLLDLTPEPGEEDPERHIKFIFHPILLLVSSIRAEIEAGCLTVGEDGAVEVAGSVLRNLLLSHHRLFRGNWGVELGENTNSGELVPTVLGQMRRMGYLRGPDAFDRCWVLPAAALVAAEYAPEPKEAPQRAASTSARALAKPRDGQPDLFGMGEQNP
jgi:uncharacterized protein (TIGR02678 family)